MLDEQVWTVECGQCRCAVAVVFFSAATDYRVKTTEYLAVDWRRGISNLLIIYELYLQSSLQYCRKFILKLDYWK